MQNQPNLSPKARAARARVRTCVSRAAFALACPALAFAQTAPSTPATAASARAGEAVQLSTFTVSEQQDIGYESMQTTSGMRTVQELKNVANSISIMNSQFMEDLGLTTMEEMSTWFVSGESNPDPNATVSSRVILRGIANAYALRNGWIWYSPMDSYSTERVEVLRGPNAFLYGEADVGGAQNQITKRGLFTRTINRAKLMVGSHALIRGEMDLNRRLNDKLAVRVSAVQSNNESWISNVRRDFRGVYGAVTYRPFRNTTISAMAEHDKTTSVLAQGLFVDAYSRAASSTLAIGGGYIYQPANGQSFRAQGRVISTGAAVGIVDQAIVPKSFQSIGPLATFKNYTDSLTLEAEHHIGRNLHLQVTGNFYQQQIDNWGVSARNITRDRSPLLPNGQPNPYFNELYTEYFRTRNLNGNIVRDIRASAVYDVNTSWMKQQLVANVQQHQDNPGQKKPKYGEYLDMGNPNWTGTVNTAGTQAAFTANRTTFTNNRFMRRYYLKDGVTPEQTSALGPIPGLSAWYPDLSNLVGASGNIIDRRFYTPSWGVGASGSYFKEHFFTMVGYRQDQFKMKTFYGAVQPQKEWVNTYVETLNPKPFVKYKVDGANYGGIFRLNDMFAIGYNYAQSFRISVGEGAATYRVGELQGIPVGEGSDISARLTLFKGKVEISAVHFKNFTPNARFSPGAAINVRDELAAIFPTTFNSAGTADYQTTTTSGDELEVVANPVRGLRISANYATNKVVNVDRAPLLKEFQAEAKALNKPTPLLTDFLQTIPEGLPNPGYTKARANVFGRYQFMEGALKGISLGLGANWRLRTYRGSVNLSGLSTTPAINLYSPAYTLFNFTAGYSTKLMNRPTSFNLNVDNLADKEYYRSTALGSGSWGDPRGYKLTIVSEF
jgi:outer membrane receptor protein involved in Fe transport